MPHKRTFWTFLFTALLVISTAVTQAQSTGRKSWPRGNAGSLPAPPVPEPAAERETETTEPEAQEQGSLRDLNERQKKAIAGSWLGISSEGNRVLQSFTCDGVFLASVQGGVNTDPMFGVLTPGHGVWRHLGGRQFAATAISVNYDINTGAYLGYLKARLVLTINKAGDQMTGTD
ncbi:MAG: hypothetical protein ACKV2V_18125, partial [Blastocatellia bacterium]